MEAIAEAVKTHFIPGSTTALIFGLVAGLILWARTKRWAIRWLAFLTAFYWIISTALFAGGFEKILSGNYARVEKSELPSHVEAIVILGGGSETYSAEAGSINAMSDATSLRVLEGARLASILPEAQVIVSGGPELKSGRKIPETEPMMQALGLLGIDQERVSAESQSAPHVRSEFCGAIPAGHLTHPYEPRIGHVPQPGPRSHCCSCRTTFVISRQATVQDPPKQRCADGQQNGFPRAFCPGLLLGEGLALAAPMIPSVSVIDSRRIPNG
jgi:hypothetical protein